MKLVLVIMVLVLASCGYSSKNNELIGQVKKVVKNTPIICPDYTDADISMGVMRNGVGSMSSEDAWMYIADPESLTVLKSANESGALVKVTYDVRRIAFCVDERMVTKVELVK